MPKDMYLIEFDDVEVKADPHDPTRRIGKIRIMDKAKAAALIQNQVEALKKVLEDIPTPSVLKWPRPSKTGCALVGKAKRPPGPPRL